MNEEGSHHDDTARGNNAMDRRDLCREFVNAVSIQYTDCVRPRQNTERTILTGRIIETETQRPYMAHNVCRSLSVRKPFLHRPRPPARKLDPLSQGQRNILVPCH